MARVTVEDCIEKVPSRFELVLLAAHRARQIAGGAPPLVERDRDKDPVVALREIGDGELDKDELREDMVVQMCRHAHQEAREAEGDYVERQRKPEKEMSEEEMMRNLPDISTEPPVGPGSPL